jgi:hypothetical protein
MMLNFRLLICRFFLFLSNTHLHLAKRLSDDAQEMFQEILDKYFSDEGR